jgi:hypothetical protein
MRRSPPLLARRSLAAALRRAVALVAVGSAALGCGGDSQLAPGGSFAIGVVDYSPGPGGGFGADRLPDVVLGAPRGAGLRAGSTDTLSLGTGGSVTLELGVVAVDGPGADLLVFENAFRVSGSATDLWVEPAQVEVSADGATWTAFPCDALTAPYVGCAGLAPVLANADTNTLDPLDPLAAGGDAFDLATIGVPRARFVRLTDGGHGRMDGAGTDGFDLDALAVVHAEGQ